MTFFRRRISYIVAPLIGLGLFAAARLPFLAENDKMAVWGAVFAVTVVFTAGAAFFVARESGRGLRAVRWAVPVVLLVTSAFVFLLIVETAAGRYGLAGLVMLLSAVYFENLRATIPGAGRFGPGDLMHLSFVLDAISFFFLLAFIFGFATFYNVPLPVAAMVVGLLVALMTHETLWRAGFSTRQHVSLVVAAGVLGLEAHVALSLLPTSYLVNAGVAVVLLSAAMHAVKQVLSGAGEVRFFRKEIVAALLLAGLLLGTANWS
jgi:hypothetical protein